MVASLGEEKSPKGEKTSGNAADKTTDKVYPIETKEKSLKRGRGGAETSRELGDWFRTLMSAFTEAEPTPHTSSLELSRLMEPGK